MNIRYFQYLIEIARCGSINQAAINLYISQPTLSGVIKRTENEVGYKIFDSGPSGSSLTKEGMYFIHSAENIMNEVERMYLVPSLIQKDNTLSICCNYSSSMMNLFLKFSNMYKGEKQDCFKETGLHHALHDAITHAYRLTFFYAFNKRIEVHINNLSRYGFQVKRISGTVPISCMMSAQNPLSNKDSLCIEDLRNCKIVCFEDFGYDDWLGPMGVWTKEDYDTTRLLNVFDRGGLVETIMSGNYLAIVPSHPNDTQHFQNLELRPLTNTRDELHWYLTYPEGYQMNFREKQYHDEVCASLAKVYPLSCCNK